MSTYQHTRLHNVDGMHVVRGVACQTETIIAHSGGNSSLGYFGVNTNYKILQLY